jgi:hypothetical protein
MFSTMKSNLYYSLGQSKLKMWMIIIVLKYWILIQKLQNVNQNLTKMAAVDKFFFHLQPDFGGR